MKFFKLLRLISFSILILSSFQAFSQEPDIIALLKINAENGNPKAQFEYGKYLLENKKIEKAKIWIKKSADAEFPEAIFYMGYAGLGDKSSNDYYEKAARLGYKDAFPYLLDNYLFRAGGNADIFKAKEFADLARHFKIEQQIYRNLDIVDHCYKAGKPKILQQDNQFNGEVFELCKDLKNDKEQYKACLFEKGTNVDFASFYANGEYVQQDFSKSMSYVCHGTYIPAELEDMVKTLHDAMQNKVLETPFDYCEHATGSNSISVCYSQKSQLTYDEIQNQLKLIESQLNNEQRILFEKLIADAYTFFNLRSLNEQDLSGTLRGVFITEMDIEQKQWLLNRLQSVMSSDFKRLNIDYTIIRNQLIDAYYALMSEMDKSLKRNQEYDFYPLISKENIKISHHSWVVFREAFAKFAHDVKPEISENEWRAWLTKIRMKQLSDIKSIIL